MTLPVKLVDLGGGIGQLREFGASDKLPTSVFPDEFTISKDANPVINGDMEISQRGSSFAALSGYGLDRWTLALVSAAAITVSQQIDAPALSDSYYSQRLVVTTADSSIAATDYCTLSQKIEGLNVYYYIGKPFTVSFWVRSPKTGIHCVALRNSGNDRSYVSEFTVAAVNTWEFKTISVPAGLITAGTWDWLNGTGLELSFVLAAGSNFYTSAGAWQTGNFLATSNQVNCLDAINNTFAVTDVKINRGTLPLKAPGQLTSQKLISCQRYYEITATAIYNNNGTSRLVNGANVAYAPWRVTKRATPAVTWTATALANVWSVIPGGATVHGSRVVVIQDGAGAMEFAGTVSGSAEL